MIRIVAIFMAKKDHVS